MRITLFGIGEAGRLIGNDLRAAGVEVHCFDPAPVATPDGMIRHDDPASAVEGADWVMALNAMRDARAALEQAIDAIPSNAVYADFSTSDPAFKRALSETAAARGLAFVDVALMSTVPGTGMYTPMLISGTGAKAFLDTFEPQGLKLTLVEGPAGSAALRKLLRSIFVKGLAGLAIESLNAAQKSGLGDWGLAHLAETMDGSDAAFLKRLVVGTGIHARRRLDEMNAAKSLLESLDIEPLMTRGTIANLERVLNDGLPDLPSMY